MEKLEPSCAASGNVINGAVTKEVQQVPPQNNHMTQQFHFWLYAQTCTQMCIAALFILASKWKQFKCPSTAKCLNKMQYTHKMEYYSMIRNENLIHAIT